MADLGLIGGIADGFKEGLKAYQDQKQRNFNNRMLLADMMSKGFQSDADGNVTPGEGLLAKQQAEKIQNQGLIAANDPTSSRSQQYSTALGGIGMKVPNGMSEVQLKELQPVYEAKFKAQEAGRLAGLRTEYQEKRLGYQSDKEARGAANNDPMLKIYTPRLEGAAKIGELINAARTGKVVSNSALLGQLNAETARLETGSQSPGLGAGEKTELIDKKAQLKAVIDSITGNPEDAVDPRVLNTADKMVKELTNSYMSGIDSRFEFLKGGASPNQTQIFTDKHEALKRTYLPRFGHWGDQLQSSQAGAGLINPGQGQGKLPPPPKIGDVVQGHRYKGGEPSDPNSWEK